MQSHPSARTVSHRLTGVGPRSLLAFSLLWAVGLLSACAQPLGASQLTGTGASWTGGAVGQTCNPQTDGEGCNAQGGVTQMVQCDASGVWVGKAPCLNGAVCVEQSVSGSTKRTATCVGTNVAAEEDAGSGGNTDPGNTDLDGISLVEIGRAHV